MITKHSADENSVKPIQVGLRLARVVSIGNGTADVCPIGSSVVLHDIPVTSATTMSPGDVINLQMIDNKRFAFAQQNAAAEPASSTSNVTIQNGDVIIAGEGGAGTVLSVSGSGGIVSANNSGAVTLTLDNTVARNTWSVGAGNGLTGGGNLSATGISLNVVGGDGIVVSADSVSVSSDVVRTSRTISAGDGLSGGGALSADRSFAVNSSVARNTWEVSAGDGLSGGGNLSASGISFAVDNTVVRTSRVVSTSSGLSGGGDLSADRTLSLNLATASGLNTVSGLAITTSGSGTGLSLTSNVLGVNVANGIEISGNSVGLKTGSATGLYLNGGVLSAKPGIGVAVDGADNTLYVKSAAAVNEITSGITVNANGVSVDSSVARDTWQVNPASGGGLSGGGNLSAVTPPAFSIATGTNTGLLLDGGLLKLDTSVAGNGLAMGTDRVMAVELSAASGLELSGTSPNKTLQISDSVAGFGIVINSNTKVLSVVSDTTTLSVSENSVDVNTGYAFPWTNNHTWSTSASIASSGAMSGFAGSGWLVRNSGSLGLMDIDELSVRGRLRVYELLIQQIRATNGSIFVSSSAKAASVTGSGPYTITIDAKDTDFCPFAVGDLLRAQRVDLGGVSSNSPDIVWQSNLRVDSISGLSFTATLVSGSAPAVGMEYVRLGNDTTTTRQSSVYMTADDSFAPYIDVVSGVASFADWGTKIRTRIGRLDGVTVSIVGSTAGSNEFGIWAGTGTGVNNRYIRISDKVVELRNVPIELYGNNSNVQMRLTGGDSNNQPTFAMGATLPTSSVSNDTGIWMGQDAAGGDYKFRVGQITSGSLNAGILWDGSTLTVTGAINILSGGTATAAASTTYADTKASTAQSNAISTAASDATSKANAAQTNAISAAASDATSKANAAQANAQLYSDNRLATIVDYSTGKAAFTVAQAPTGAGLYLGNNYLGYYSGGWKTYMDGSGNFYLGGTAGSLTWNGTTLAVSGNLTANAGSFAGPVTLSAAGGLWQGNGTWSSVSNGLKLWADTVSHVYQINLTGATSGTFTATVGANTTAAQAYNVAAATLQSAITGLASVGANNATVSLSNGIYTITFIGDMIGQAISISANLTGITGGTKTAGTIRYGSLAGQISIYDAGDERVVIGNLKGDYDYTVDSFGLASGRYATSWIGVDDTNGIRVMNSTTERFRVTTGGVVTIGNQNSTTEPYFSIDATNGFRILRNAIARFTIDVNGNLNINNSAGTSVISMDTSGGAKFANTVTIGTEIGFVPGTDPYIAIGGTAYPTGFLTASTTGIWMGSASNSPKMRVGTTDASGVLTAGMQWDGSALTVAGTINASAGNFAGYVTVGASGGIYQGSSGTGASPNTGMRIRQNSSYGSVELWSASAIGGIFGNLNGNYGYAANTYGLAVGSYGANLANVTIEPTNGFRIRNNATTVFQVTNAGALTSGNTSGQHVAIDSTNGVSVKNGTATRLNINSSGVLSINDSNGNAVISLDNSGNASIEGDLSIGSGGGIYQGNGTFASPDTGLKIFSTGVNQVSTITVTATGGTFTVTVVRNDTNASATTASLAYNITAASMQTAIQGLSSVGSGNATVTLSGGVYAITFAGARASTKMTVTVATGSLTGGTATVASTVNGGRIGTIAGYKANTLQWSADTDGSIKAGAGDVVIDSNGVNFNISTTVDPFYANPSSFTSAVTFSGSSLSSPVFSIGVSKKTSAEVSPHPWTGYKQQALWIGGSFVAANSIGLIYLRPGDFPPTMTIYRGNSSSLSGAKLYGNLDVEDFVGDGSTGNFTSANATISRLNVGSATGAAAGQIKASAGIIATTASFSSTLGVTGAATLSSTLAVTGASTLTGALSVDGELGYSGSSTWINTSIVFNTNWSNFGADETTWSFARYKRIGDLVFLRGMIKRAAGTGLSTSPFTLPANFRPAKRQICTVFGLKNAGTAAALRVDVFNTGVIQFSDIDTTSAYDYISLNGIVFSVT